MELYNVRNTTPPTAIKKRWHSKSNEIYSDIADSLYSLPAFDGRSLSFSVELTALLKVYRDLYVALVKQTSRVVTTLPEKGHVLRECE